MELDNCRLTKGLQSSRARPIFSFPPPFPLFFFLLPSRSTLEYCFSSAFHDAFELTNKKQRFRLPPTHANLSPPRPHSHPLTPVSA